MREANSLTGGSKKFEDILDKKLQGRFMIGKIQLQKFKFTRLNIEQTAEGIFIDQIDYINSILPITMNRVGPKDEKLTDKEFKAYRALTGQLSWAAENSRPDLSFDVRFLATKNKHVTLDDIHTANKIIRKAHLRKVRLKYSRLGSFNDLKLIGYTDSSYRNTEDMTKSVGGRVIFLVNKEGLCCPIVWKSKTIQQTCKSVKTAETRSLDLGMEDCIFLSRMISELYTGKVDPSKHIPVEMKIDSKTLYDSIESSKQIEEKSTRHILAWIKEQIESRSVNEISWVCSQEMLADVFTKRNAKPDNLLFAITNGNIP